MNTDVAIIAHPITAPPQLIPGFYQDQGRVVVTHFHMTYAVVAV